MRMRFTNHAKYRILERKIKMIDIKETLINPDYRRKVYDNKISARKSFGGKTLEIIYTEEKSEILIVTAYYL